MPYSKVVTSLMNNSLRSQWNRILMLFALKGLMIKFYVFAIIPELSRGHHLGSHLHSSHQFRTSWCSHVAQSLKHKCHIHSSNHCLQYHRSHQSFWVPRGYRCLHQAIHHLQLFVRQCDQIYCNEIVLNFCLSHIQMTMKTHSLFCALIRIKLSICLIGSMTKSNLTCKDEWE